MMRRIRHAVVRDLLEHGVEAHAVLDHRAIRLPAQAVLAAENVRRVMRHLLVAHHASVGAAEGLSAA